jgi:hypothetical protein
MNTKDLLKEAIADAKAVRETALAQAKLALEESFMPRLTSMFNARLQEKMDDLEEKDNMIDELDGEMVDEAEAEIAKKAMKDLSEMNMDSYDDKDNTVEEIDLEEILAELGDMDKDDLKEAKEEEIEAEEDVEDMEDDEEEDEEEEKEVSELSMDELEELIRDIVSQEMGGDGEADMDVDASMDMDMDMTDELPDTTDDEVVDIEEVNLDEILAELLGEEIELTEGKKRNKYGGNKGDVPASKRGDKKDTAEEEGVEDYKKKKKSLKEEMSATDVAAMITSLAVPASIVGAFISALKGKSKAEQMDILKNAANAMAGSKGISSEGLEETINTLREELQEVNLLNAKLLYVNKIFKSKNLNESQKIKVIQAFDKAESAKEAKLVYESLNENFAAKSGKATIKESLGFASKAAGVAPQKQTIVESNEFIARMKKLANIK